MARLDPDEGQNPLVAYLIGVFGVLGVLVVAITLATEAGWIAQAKDKLRGMSLPSFSSLPALPSVNGGASDASSAIFRIVEQARNQGDFASERLGAQHRLMQGVTRPSTGKD